MVLSLLMTCTLFDGANDVPHALKQSEERTPAFSEVAAVDGPAALLKARYRTASPQEPAHWNAVLGQILAHRSVRSYKPDPLPEGTLETLVAAAQYYPSNCGT
ncbi:nitroreductase family protein [Bosea sp. ASV33]|uniref:nitroreductase family protein n=1 Tax=Bosea sp. ASV33 TaxID=2795106 RepID=UPI0020BF1707|nr:nitroreductase family protein [Bosea sp. ASV33]